MGEPASKRFEIFVASDGTGDTGAAVVRAVMLQFQGPWRLRVFGGIRQSSEVRRVVEEAERIGALIVFSLVDSRVASELIKRAQKAAVGTVDLLGPLISKVAQDLHAEPRHEPNLLHGFSDDYFKRIEAVEFAVNHDDGANLRTLHEADIVLTGVSRTSKTPLTMYLAQRGYRTGNVPLVAGMEPPRALSEIDRRKVFGLLIHPEVLLTVRKSRMRALRTPPFPSYVDADRVVLEIEKARRYFRAQGWKTVDITGRAVEENASRILEMYHADPPPES